ncbi:outer membrane protein assembly factor BamB family protein [Frigoribacterium salinisoli]
MPTDDAPWRPDRPAAGRPASAPRATPPRGASTQEARPAPAAPAPRPAPRAPRPAPLVRPGRSVAAALLALCLGGVVVVAGGSLAGPDYPRPTRGAEPTLPELRTPPTPDGWTLDLAGLLAPEAPRRCVNLWPSPAAEGLVAVGASVDLDGGDGEATGACRRAAGTGVASRVALVEAATGRVRWVHDLADDLDGTDAFAIPSSQVVPDAGRVLVQVQVGGTASLTALDLADGRPLETVRGRRDLPTVSVDVRGRLQLRTAGTPRDAGPRWALVDASSIGDPLWEGPADEGTTPLLLPDALLVVADGRTVRVDGGTGEVRPFSASPVDVAAAPPTAGAGGAGRDPGRVTYAVGGGPAGSSAVSALDDQGRALWSVPTASRRLDVTASCVVTPTDGATGLTCLDRASGRTRWSTDLGAPWSLLDPPGLVGDDLVVVTTRDGAPLLLVLRGEDGRPRSSTRVEGLDDVVGASRTTLLLAIDPRDGRRALQARDLATGATLWSRTPTGRLSFWGSELVEVDDRGTARRLAATSRVVAP